MKLLKAGTGTIHGQSGFLVSAGTAGTPANEHSRSLSLCLSHSGNSYPSSLMFCHDFFSLKVLLIPCHWFSHNRCGQDEWRAGEKAAVATAAVL